MGRTFEVGFSPSSRLIELMMARPGIRFRASSTTSASVESTRMGAGTRVAIFSRMEVMYPFSSSPTMAQHRSDLNTFQSLLHHVRLGRIYENGRGDARGDLFQNGSDVSLLVFTHDGAAQI